MYVYCTLCIESTVADYVQSWDYIFAGIETDTVFIAVTENPAYGQHKVSALAHDYELPSRSTNTSPISIPHSQPPQPEPYYEIMARFEASSEYVPMKSRIKESECCVDGPIYEELP